MRDDFWNDVLSSCFIPTMCSVDEIFKEFLPEDFDPEFEAKYREVGIVKEDHSISGVIIKEETRSGDSEWICVTYEEFLSLVKKREIKHLQWNADKNRMTLRKAKVNSSIERINSIDDYFRHDVIFNCKPDSGRIPCAICSILQVDKVDTITMLIASGDKTEQLFQAIQQFSIESPKPQKCKNSISVIIPFNQFADFVNSLSNNGFKMSYCMESANNTTLEDVYGSRIPKRFRQSPRVIYEQVRRLIQ